jgi:hypothetical protein
MLLAQTKWRKPVEANRLPETLKGIVFKDGTKQLQHAARSLARQFSSVVFVQHIKTHIWKIFAYTQI